MSDVQHGDDWWMATDGKWYPPASHPSNWRDSQWTSEGAPSPPKPPIQAQNSSGLLNKADENLFSSLPPPPPPNQMHSLTHYDDPTKRIIANSNSNFRFVLIAILAVVGVTIFIWGINAKYESDKEKGRDKIENLYPQRR
jgi:hypothetical protein